MPEVRNYLHRFGPTSSPTTLFSFDEIFFSVQHINTLLLPILNEHLYIYADKSVRYVLFFFFALLTLLLLFFFWSQHECWMIIIKRYLKCIILWNLIYLFLIESNLINVRKMRNFFFSSQIFTTPRVNERLIKGNFCLADFTINKNSKPQEFLRWSLKNLRD